MSRYKFFAVVVIRMQAKALRSEMVSVSAACLYVPLADEIEKRLLYQFDWYISEKWEQHWDGKKRAFDEKT